MEANKQNVLSCIDGSVMSESVCDYSSWISATVSAPLKLLHTIEHKKSAETSDLSGAIGLGASEELLEELTRIEQDRSRLLIQKGKIMLDAAKQKALDAGVEHIEMSQRHGSLTEALIDLEDDIRVLVLGLKGVHHQKGEPGIGHQLESVIRALHKPIFVVNGEFTKPQNVMLAFDGSEACNKALSMVASSPLFKSMPCHLVHVGEQTEDKQAMIEAAANQLRDAGHQVVTAVVSGTPEEALAKYQGDENIDVMAMGAFTHNKLRDFLLGSFTAKMLETTNKPLLLLR